MKENKILSIIEHIEKENNLKMTEIHNILENLDQLVTKVIVENKTKANTNDKNGKYPWVPDIIIKKKILKYWKIIHEWGDKAPKIEEMKKLRKEAKETDR